MPTAKAWAGVKKKQRILRLVTTAEAWARVIRVNLSITFQNHIMFCRTIIEWVAKVENLPLQHHGAEREYVNSVVNNDIDRTIDVFGLQNGIVNSFF